MSSPFASLPGKSYLANRVEPISPEDTERALGQFVKPGKPVCLARRLSLGNEVVSKEVFDKAMTVFGDIEIEPRLLQYLQRTFCTLYQEEPFLLNPIFRHQGKPIDYYFRGCGAREFLLMAAENSAGGVPANAEAKPPEWERVLLQVAGDGRGRLPEFTTDWTLGCFSFGSIAAVFEIERRYLAKGSVAEQGFVASPDCPVRLIAWSPGPKLRQVNKASPSLEQERRLAAMNAALAQSKTV